MNKIKKTMAILVGLLSIQSTHCMMGRLHAIFNQPQILTHRVSETPEEIRNNFWMDVSSGNIKRVEAVLQSPAGRYIDLNQPDERSGDTLLNRAVETNNPELVALLMNHGADINKKSPNGMTPLIKALVTENSITAHFLILSANIRLNHNNGLELISACLHQQYDLIEPLVVKGALIPENILDYLQCFSSDDVALQNKVKFYREYLSQALRFQQQINQSLVREI